MYTTLFKYGFYTVAQADIGRSRTSNQDEVILCPNQGFFAISDGMGGLPDGGKTSAMLKVMLPAIIQKAGSELERKISVEYAGELLKEQVSMISDTIYDTRNKGRKINFGATLSGVWLVDRSAIFVNLGDSRGYILSCGKKEITQVTCDHNNAARLIKSGILTKEEAHRHPSGSELTRFVGMPAPAIPEIFKMDVKPGDRIILCSDGLYGMLDEEILSSILLSGKDPNEICKEFIDKANTNGGRDNISVVYVKIVSNR